VGALMVASHDLYPTHRRYPVQVAEDVGELRRAVAAQTSRLPGLPAGGAELVATELATNILRHTNGGYVLCRATGDGMELIAVDHGPGLAPAARTPPATWPAGRGGGLGVGLVTIRRRASTFDLYSTSRGTVVLVRLQPGHAAAATGPWRWGGVNLPKGGSGESGDAWAVAADGFLTAMLVDGLGHGEHAAAAAATAVTVFRGHASATRSGERLAGVTRQVHEGMRGTRGGVLAVCLIDPREGTATFTGVGNIAGRIVSGQDSHLAPPKPKQTTHPWHAGATLVLCTDGIDTRWAPGAYPGLLRHRPAVVAATIHRDHSRGTDDAAILVVRDARDSTGGDR
jgi:anti-sigma regulatory factor (Ser/Thr protein kinase)